MTSVQRRGNDDLNGFLPYMKKIYRQLGDLCSLLCPAVYSECSDEICTSWYNGNHIQYWVWSSLLFDLKIYYLFISVVSNAFLLFTNGYKADMFGKFSCVILFNIFMLLTLGRRYHQLLEMCLKKKKQRLL